MYGTSEGCDAGMLAIGARFSAAAALGLGQGADGALDGIMPARRSRNPVMSVPIFIPVTLSGGAGVASGIIGAQGPPAGSYWFLRRLIGQGWTAGTVQVFESSVNGELIVPFAAAGTFTFSRGEMPLNPQSYLVVQATGITGQVAVFGRADAVPAWYLNSYLI
jgi:hypothetical protein